MPRPPKSRGIGEAWADKNPAPRCVVSSARPRLLLLLHRGAMVRPAFHHACRMLSPSKASPKRLHHSFSADGPGALDQPQPVKCHPMSVGGDPPDNRKATHCWYSLHATAVSRWIDPRLFPGREPADMKLDQPGPCYSETANWQDWRIAIRRFWPLRIRFCFILAIVFFSFSPTTLRLLGEK